MTSTGRGAPSRVETVPGHPATVTLPAAPRGPAADPARRLHVVLVVPRGEAVRNFLYSETLPTLRRHARVTLLSVIDDTEFMDRFAPIADRVIRIEEQREKALLGYLRRLIYMAHYRWLWSAAARYLWAIMDYEAVAPADRIKRILLKAAVLPVANRPALEALTRLEQAASWYLRPNDEFVALFRQLAPDVVFNCSHIHGPAGELPLKVARRLGIRTAGFIFSWDNLTSRSRIFVPYDDYLVWNESQGELLRSIYPFIDSGRVAVTGTPQFDFHFHSRYQLGREELCRRIGLDPARPYVLYTTGIHTHFPEEHRTVELVTRLLADLEESRRPQLVVRTYVKGTSREMYALADRNLPGVVFPPVEWEEKWYTPMPEDLPIYTSLLRHASVGINVASTVSLELLMHDKPVINLGFDPPGSDIPRCRQFRHHLELDHYLPLVDSGAVMVARSEEDLRRHLVTALDDPGAGSERRRAFVKEMFGPTLDGGCGRRVAERLLALAREAREGRP